MFLTQLVAKQMIAQSRWMDAKARLSMCPAAAGGVLHPNRGEYCVSKAGVSMLTTLYADRLAAEGILVNEVRPGWLPPI